MTAARPAMAVGDHRPCPSTAGSMVLRDPSRAVLFRYSLAGTSRVGFKITYCVCILAVIVANEVSHLSRGAAPYFTPFKAHPAPASFSSHSVINAPRNFAHAGSLLWTAKVIAASISDFNAGRSSERSTGTFQFSITPHYNALFKQRAFAKANFALLLNGTAKVVSSVEPGAALTPRYYSRSPAIYRGPPAKSASGTTSSYDTLSRRYGFGLGVRILRSVIEQCGKTAVEELE